MIKKFEQKIYLTEKSDKEIVIKEYTIEELKTLLAPAVMINLYYVTQNPKYWMWQRTDKKLTGEKWRNCPSYPLYQASDFGRVRNIKTKKILEQYEGKKQDGHYKYKTVKDIKKAINDNPMVKDIGYLQVNGYDVHRLVADAWLVKEEDGCEIHHISNDGYDNCPYNLIYLPKKYHNKNYKDSVHSNKLQEIIPFHYHYSGPRNKLI